MPYTAMPKKGEKILIGVLLAGLLLSLALLACTPPFSRDALIHHLQLPKLYLQHGGIYEIPELKFSYYPMNLDLLYIGVLSLGNDILAKYFHMLFGLGTALLLYTYLKKRLSTVYGLLGALFFLSIPIIVKLSITVYVDLGLVFFTTASMILLFRWLETKRPRDLLLAGICCGLGIGTKYNGLLVLFILTFMLPILFIRTQEQKQGTAHPAIKATALFCLAAILASSPWLIRNTVWTGNPICPLYNGLFNPASSPAQVEDQIKENEENIDEQISSGARGVLTRRYVLYQESVWQLLLLPVRIFFEGRDNDPRYFDGRLNPFLFFLPLLSFLGIRRDEKQVRLEKITLAAFSLFYFLFAFNTGVLRIRYLTPMVPFLVVLSMDGLKNLEGLAEQHANKIRFSKLIRPLTIILLLLWNGSYLWQQFQEIDPLSYITGRVSRDEYLTQKIPEYPVMQYANKNLPDTAKILCLFLGQRGYYLNKPHHFDSYGNPDFLLSWLQQPENSIDTVFRNLQDKKITHLLVRADLMVEWLNRVKKPTRQLWNQLNSNHLIAVHTHLNYILFQINFSSALPTAQTP